MNTLPFIKRAVRNERLSLKKDLTDVAVSYLRDDRVLRQTVNDYLLKANSKDDIWVILALYMMLDYNVREVIYHKRIIAAISGGAYLNHDSKL